MLSDLQTVRVQHENLNQISPIISLCLDVSKPISCTGRVLVHAPAIDRRFATDLLQSSTCYILLLYVLYSFGDCFHRKRTAESCRNPHALRTRPERLLILLTLDIDGIFRHAIAVLQLLLDYLQALRVLLPCEGREDTPVLALSHDPTFRIIGRPIRRRNFIAAWGSTHCR